MRVSIDSNRWIAHWVNIGIVLLLAGCVHGPWPGASPTHPEWAPPAAIAYPAPGPPYDMPRDDPFYRQPAPARLAAMTPGTIIRYRPIVPRAYRISHVQARAWQFVYRSLDEQERPVANTATLLIPPNPKRRLLAYQVAYDALNPVCAPSQELVRGTMIEQWFVSKALRRGWPVVLSDYEGPDLAFLAGHTAGYAVLDAIRGAQRFAPAEWLDTNTPIALWGYSGGGYASLWAGELAMRYAPKLPIVGIAAGGAPADLAAVARHINGGLFAGVYFQAVLGLARAYPSLNLDRLLNERGREMRDRLATSCLGQELAWVRDPLLSGYSFANIADYITVDDLLDVPAIDAIVADNRLGRRTVAAPLFYYQAWFDPLTPRIQTRRLAGRYCENGVQLDFDWVIGEHLISAVANANRAIDYLADRFAHRTPNNDCGDIRRRWPD